MNNGLFAGLPNELPPASATQYSYTTSDFNKTSNTTLSSITGLTASLTSGGVYKLACTFFVPTGAGLGNYSYDLGGGTVTASVVVGVFGYSTNSAGVGAQLPITSLTSSVGASATNQTSYMVQITAFVTASTTGTISPRFAQASSSVTTQTVSAGSFMVVEKMN